MNNRFMLAGRRLQAPFRGRFLIAGVAMLAVVVTANHAAADGPFQRLRRGFDAVRPGWIIPHATEPEPSDPTPKNKAKKTPTKARAVAPAEKPADSTSDVTPTPDRVSERSADLPTDSAPLLDQLAIGAPVRFGAVAEVSPETDVLAIVEVDPKGAANAAGLQVGDVIKKVGGIEINNPASLKGITDALDGGVVVEFEIVRDAEDLKVPVQFGKFRAAENSKGAGPISAMDTRNVGVSVDAKQPVVIPTAIPAGRGNTPTLAPPIESGNPRLRSVLERHPTPTPTATPVLPSEAEPLSTLLDLSIPNSEVNAILQVEPDRATPQDSGLLDFDIDNE